MFASRIRLSTVANAVVWPPSLSRYHDDARYLCGG